MLETEERQRQMEWMLGARKRSGQIQKRKKKNEGRGRGIVG